MYFAIKDYGSLKIKEINGDLDNVFETHNEMKIIKTKINGEVKVYILLYNEVTNAKSMIMAHGGVYSEDELVITDSVDDREYQLEGEIITRNGFTYEDEVVDIKANKCKFVEFPLIDELLSIRGDEITQFITCLEVLKDNDDRFITFKKKNNL